MSKFCEICGKGAMTGHNVSRSNRKTNRKWEPNLQKVRAVVDGKVQRITVCTKCIKSGKVVKPG